MINFDLTERSAAEGVIISNASGIAGASYYITVDSSMAAGRYYLAGNAKNIASVTIVGTSTKVLAGGEGVNYEGNRYNLNWDGSNALYLDVAKVSFAAAAAGSWETPDLGTWDDPANNMAESTLTSSEEKKDSGILAAI